jgi:hypothetical protein
VSVSACFWNKLAKYLLDRKIFRTKVAEENITLVMFHALFSRKLNEMNVYTMLSGNLGTFGLILIKFHVIVVACSFALLVLHNL